MCGFCLDVFGYTPTRTTLARSPRAWRDAPFGAAYVRLATLASLRRPRMGRSGVKRFYRRTFTSPCWRESGEAINGKRVARIRRQRGLLASRRPGKRRRVSPKSSKRQRSSRPNEVWSYDFIEDVTVKGRRLRILSVIDEYTRECLLLRAAPSYPARRVLDSLEEILVCNGRKPENVRSDNGPEFIAKRVQQWADAGRIGLRYIKPGSPWENGNVESFHASLRAELLERELFFSVAAANAMLEDWREEYNFKRPHGSLGYQTPAAAARRELPLRATPCAPVPAGNPNLNQ